MGCIILEFIVWMVYGAKRLDKFNDNIVNDFGKSCHYFEMEKRNGEVSSRVHEAVREMMDSLAREPECAMGETALGDLLEVVKTRLLVVRLGPPTFGKGKPQQPDANGQIERADSMALNRKLDAIIKRGEQNPSYWLQGEKYDDLPSLFTPQAVNSEDIPQDFLGRARKCSTGSTGGLLTSRSTSLVVPVLTGGIGVG